MRTLRRVKKPTFLFPTSCDVAGIAAAVHPGETAARGGLIPAAGKADTALPGEGPTSESFRSAVGPYDRTSCILTLSMNPWNMLSIEAFSMMS